MAVGILEFWNLWNLSVISSLMFLKEGIKPQRFAQDDWSVTGRKQNPRQVVSGPRCCLSVSHFWEEEPREVFTVEMTEEGGNTKRKNRLPGAPIMHFNLQFFIAEFPSEKMMQLFDRMIWDDRISINKHVSLSVLVWCPAPRNTPRTLIFVWWYFICT